MSQRFIHPVRPPMLQRGDTVGLVAPASPLLDLRDIDRARKVLSDMGFRVKEGLHVRRRHGFLAGEDHLRTEDIQRMFEDRGVQAVMALRGGYGSGRLLEKLDWDLIAHNPKVLVGHSDLTALLNAANQRTGLITFWGPMAGYDMGRFPTLFKTRHFKTVTCSLESPLKLPASPAHPRRKLKVLSSGTAEGRLVGGNLSIIVSLMGTSYEIDTTGKVFFFEDVDEEPYKIDRMLNQLALSGKLQSAAGIVVGRCVNCESTGRMRRTFRLVDVLDNYLSGLGVPVVFGHPIGHETEKITLPIGVMARLEASPRPSLTLLEPAVTKSDGEAA